jgi:hypothetical protein
MIRRLVVDNICLVAVDSAIGHFVYYTTHKKIDKRSTHEDKQGFTTWSAHI